MSERQLPARRPRREHPAPEYLADIGFDDLPLSPKLLRERIAERGYTRPTPVQAQAFGPVIAGQGPHRPLQDRHREDRRLRAPPARED